ncbi:MAG: sensor histidine kinase, partial [Acidobacteriota bacterium]
MTISNVKALAEHMNRERGALLDQWRREVRKLPGAENLDTPTLNDHIPDLIEELGEALLSR